MMFHTHTSIKLVRIREELMFYALDMSTLLAASILLQPKPTSSSSPLASSLAISSTSCSASTLSSSPVK